MHVSRCLHITQDVVLKLRDRLKRIWHILILLDISNHFGSLCSLGEVDGIAAFDDGRDAIFNECEISEVDACDWRLVYRKAGANC